MSRNSGLEKSETGINGSGNPLVKGSSEGSLSLNSALTVNDTYVSCTPPSYAQAFDIISAANRMAAASISSINYATTPDAIIQDFYQGGVGDCWYLAGIKSLSISTLGKQAFANDIKISSTDATVTFQAVPSFSYKISLTDLANKINSSTYNLSRGDADSTLLELALNSYTSGSHNGYYTSSLDGGYIEDAFSLITGKVANEFASEDCTEVSNELNQLAKVIDHTAIGVSCYQANPALDIAAADHAYSIVGIDTVHKTVTFRNPWYSGTTLKPLSYADFPKYFNAIDYVDLSSNSKCLYANNSNSTLTGGIGDDQLYGGNGNDILVGGTGNDTIYGGAGNDSIDGGAGNDYLYGEGGGNDTINGGAGADEMYGYGNNNTYYIDDPNDWIVSMNENSMDTVISSISYELFSDIENLTLSGSSNINGTGNEYNNTIIGNSGNNLLEGNEGDDTINGMGGADTLDGGAGNDTYYVNDSRDIIIEGEIPESGIDTVISSIAVSLSDNVENLILTGTISLASTGNALDNYMTGNSGNNLFYGCAGNDTLDGGKGADTLRGSTGNDTYIIDNTGDTIIEWSNEGTDTVISSITTSLGNYLENLTLSGSASINATGNTLNNVIRGNSGSNIITGGTGLDTMYGGAGNDTYLLNSGDGKDVINDSAGTDNVKFGSSVLKKTVALFKQGVDLIVGYSSGDRLTVQGAFTSGTAIEKLQLSDNTYLSSSDINTVINNLTSYAKAHSIQLNSVDTVLGNQNLMNIVINSWHS